jgi:TRAP-type C4-dicarboxylate transport system permease small subunit
MNFFEKIGNELSRFLFWVAGTAIFFMMVLTCADVVLRLLRRPIPGTYELVCFLGAVAVSFAMAHTSVQKGHVEVSLIVRMFPSRIQGIIGSITTIFGLILFFFIAWRSFLYGNSLSSTGEVSLTLQLPFYPFVYGISFSAAVVCLVLLADLFKNFMKVRGK